MFVRRGGSSDRWLGIRMAAFGVGAILALLGMGLGSDALIMTAGGILLAGLLLGIVARRQDRNERGDGVDIEGRAGGDR